MKLNFKHEKISSLSIKELNKIFEEEQNGTNKNSR